MIFLMSMIFGLKRFIFSLLLVSADPMQYFENP